MKNLTWLFLALFCVATFAHDKTTYNPKTSEGKLHEYASYVNVKDKKLSIEDVIASKKLHFDPITSDNLSLGFTSSNYWVSFSLENSTSNNNTYYLETARPVTDLANLYVVTKDSIIKYQSGDQIPFDQRQVAHRSTVFKLQLEPNTVKDFYLELSSDGETINIPLKLYTETEFLIVNYKQQLFLGLFYGILLLAGIVYLFFFSSLSNKTFLYYSCYVLSIAFMQSALDGFIFQYVFTNAGYFNSKSVLLAALCSNFFLLKYCEHFLEVKTYLKEVRKLFNIIYLVIIILLIMTLASKETMKLVYPLSNLNGLVSLVLILISVFTLKYKKIKIDPFFSVGIFFLVIGLLGFVMNNLSLLPNNFYTLNSAKFGSGLEVIFLSLSMTNLIKKLRQEKESSQELALTRANEINELKSYFMSNMSHELRTPINAILGIAQSNLDDKNTQAKDQYQIIKNASLTLLSNVNDILDFEKIESNQLTLSAVMFNPKNLIKNISDNWQAEANKKGINYVFDIDTEIPEKVEGDADRFIQIINNVLSNAIKFTLKGEVVFKLKCSYQPNGLVRFLIQISDTGIGMSKKAQQNVFNSFNQMRNNHKRQFGGIGLGLNIVNNLVTLFEGTIFIESEINQGTRVFIDIPLKVIETQAEIETKAEENEEKDIQILVVEDNRLNQMVMKKMLSTNLRFNYTIVENGQEALDELNSNKVYDLVLMDLQMPIMDGYEATKAIREGKINSLNKDIAIIAVTADAMPKTKNRVLEIGMNDYMTKPIDKNELFNKINHFSIKPELRIA